MSLFCDVIEHMPQAEGEAVLNWLREHSKYSIITTPIKCGLHPASYRPHGNPHERHVCAWTRDMLESWGKVSEGDVLYMLEME